MFSLLNQDIQNVIVFDLEWNQSGYNPNHRMPHEIIEIGACRVDREGHVVSRFSELIRPRVYKRLDKHIKQVTGITEQELAQGRPFSDVFGDFISWCGEDAQLVTWGRDDYPVLKRNAAFFMTPMPFDPPIDAQLVFGFCCLGGEHKQMNLHAYGIEKIGATVRLAKMNFVLNNVRGTITHATPYYRDPYDSFGNFDYVMVNPPFNVDGVEPDQVKDQPRFNTYGVLQNKKQKERCQRKPFLTATTFGSISLQLR